MSQPSAISTSGTSSAGTPQVVAAAASTITFNTQAPQASWGMTQTTDVGLSSGSLEYSYPLSYVLQMV